MEQNYTFLYASLSLGTALFSLGVIGVSLRSREFALLGGVILMMLASVLTLVAYSGFHGSWSGQVFAFVVVVVMAIHVVVNSAISGRVALQPNPSNATDTNEVASELPDSTGTNDDSRS